MARNLNEPPNKNIVPRGLGPFSLMSANQFKRMTRVKLRVFVQKLLTEALI